MESGAVGSVCNFFDIPAVSFFVCSDNSASGKDLFYKQSYEEKVRVKKGLDIILEPLICMLNYILLFQGVHNPSHEQYHTRFPVLN